MPGRSRGGPGDSLIFLLFTSFSPTHPRENPAPSQPRALQPRGSPALDPGLALTCAGTPEPRAPDRSCGAGPSGLQRAAACFPQCRRASSSARSLCAGPLAVRPRVGPGEARGCGSASVGAEDGGGARCGWRAQAGAACQHPLPARRASQPSPCAALCTPIHTRRRPQEAGGPSPPCRRLLGAGWRGPFAVPGVPPLASAQRRLRGNAE